MQAEFLTVEQTAQVLNVCNRTIYRMIRAGELPHLKVLSTYRIPKTALEPTQEAA